MTTEKIAFNSTLIPLWTGKLVAVTDGLQDLAIKCAFTDEQRDIFRMQLVQARCHIEALERLFNDKTAD